MIQARLTNGGTTIDDIVISKDESITIDEFNNTINITVCCNGKCYMSETNFKHDFCALLLKKLGIDDIILQYGNTNMIVSGENANGKYFDSIEFQIWRES